MPFLSDVDSNGNKLFYVASCNNGFYFLGSYSGLQVVDAVLDVTSYFMHRASLWDKYYYWLRLPKGETEAQFHKLAQL